MSVHTCVMNTPSCPSTTLHLSSFPSPVPSSSSSITPLHCDSEAKEFEGEEEEGEGYSSIGTLAIGDASIAGKRGCLGMVGGGAEETYREIHMTVTLAIQMAILYIYIPF